MKPYFSLLITLLVSCINASDSKENQLNIVGFIDDATAYKIIDYSIIHRKDYFVHSSKTSISLAVLSFEECTEFVNFLNVIDTLYTKQDVANMINQLKSEESIFFDSTLIQVKGINYCVDRENCVLDSSDCLIQLSRPLFNLDSTMALIYIDVKEQEVHESWAYGFYLYPSEGKPFHFFMMPISGVKY